MTRLELVMTYTSVLHRLSLPPTHALAILLLAGRTQGLTRAEMRTLSGLSERSCRRILETLASEGRARISYDGHHQHGGNSRRIYHLTEDGETLARELLAHSAQ